MKPAWLFGLLLAMAFGLPAQESDTSEPAVVFRIADLYVNSPAKPLAAYQLELSAPTASVKFVGIEGGEPPAFGSPPFYDPKALQQERLILAAFNTGEADQLPKGKVRVATLHYQIAADENPQFKVKVQTAATVDGEKISVTATVEERKSE